MTKEQWSNHYTKRVQEIAFSDLLQQKMVLTKGAHLRYENLQMKPYFEQLTAKEARLFFKLRAEVYDLKVFRQYKYEDTTCRLCKTGTENLEHVVNVCKEVPRTDTITDFQTEDIDEVKAIIRRVQFFEDMVSLS